MGINIKMLYTRNNIFKKRIPNMRFWSVLTSAFLNVGLDVFIKVHISNIQKQVKLDEWANERSCRRNFRRIHDFDYLRNFFCNVINDFMMG